MKDMSEILMDYSELESIYGKKNFERKNGKIYIYQNNDIYSHGYHKWLRSDNTVLKNGHNLCEQGKTSFFTEVSVLRSKIENLIF